MPPAEAPEAHRIALLGSPNSGKTTLFNALTGLRAKTGNYPGVTVDRRQGPAATPDGPVEVIDLPGTYSLQAISEDEAVSVRVLRGQMEGETRPDGIVVVADATTLHRSLPLLAEAMQFGLPVCLALTMVDELKARGGEIDLFALRRKLGIPVFGVVGHKGIGVADLRDQLGQPKSWEQPRTPPENDPQDRFAWADQVLAEATRATPHDSALTQRLDAVLLHPVGGLLVFLAFVALFFQSIFSWAAPAMDLMSGGVEALADWLGTWMPSGWLASLVVDGVVRGVGAVLVFLPQIALLFTLIFFFEACGYMARAAFLMDRVLGSMKVVQFNGGPSTGSSGIRSEARGRGSFVSRFPVAATVAEGPDGFCRVAPPVSVPTSVLTVLLDATTLASVRKNPASRSFSSSVGPEEATTSVSSSSTLMTVVATAFLAETALAFASFILASIRLTFSWSSFLRTSSLCTGCSATEPRGFFFFLPLGAAGSGSSAPSRCFRYSS